MATIREIAREAGVGLGTASRALQGSGCVSEEKRKRVREAAERLGYVPPGGDGKRKSSHRSAVQEGEEHPAPDKRVPPEMGARSAFCCRMCRSRFTAII